MSRVFKHRLLTKEEKIARRFLFGKEWPAKQMREMALANRPKLVINVIGEKRKEVV